MIDRDNIIRMAREAGLAALLRDTQKTHEALERFAALVAAAEREQCSNHYLNICRKAIKDEREACAAICKEYDRRFDIPEVRWCAEDIRARGSA